MQSFCNFCSYQSVKKGKITAVGGCLILRNNCVKTKDEESEREWRKWSNDGTI